MVKLTSHQIQVQNRRRRRRNPLLSPMLSIRYVPPTTNFDTDASCVTGAEWIAVPSDGRTLVPNCGGVDISSRVTRNGAPEQ